MVKYLALAGLSLLPTSPSWNSWNQSAVSPRSAMLRLASSCHQWPVPSVPCVAPYHDQAPPVTIRSQVQLWINNNSQSQSPNGSREASRRRAGISLCLMSLICMQCCCHHWSLPLSRADITMGGCLVTSLVTRLTWSLADVRRERVGLVINQKCF